MQKEKSAYKRPYKYYKGPDWDKRDKELQQMLASMGWISITLWECQLKPGIRERTLRSLAFTLSRIFIENHRVRQMVASG